MMELKNGVVVPSDEVMRVMALLRALREDPRLAFSLTKYWFFRDLENYATDKNHQLPETTKAILKDYNLMDNLEGPMSPIVASIIECSVETKISWYYSLIINDPVKKIHP